jgi:diaminopropionate ammonia-lyase
MRILGNPLPGDPQIISGESGGVSMGIIAVLLQNDNYKMMAEKLNLDEESRILLISTEGDTDPVNYRNIVWDGIYTSY